MILQTMKIATARKQRARRGDLHPKKRWFVADQSAVWVIHAPHQIHQLNIPARNAKKHAMTLTLDVHHHGLLFQTADDQSNPFPLPSIPVMNM